MGEYGVDGLTPPTTQSSMEKLRKAQAAVARHKEFAGTVAFVETTPRWDADIEQLMPLYATPLYEIWEKVGSQPPYHYLGSGKIMFLMGYDFGQAMRELVSD